MCILLLAFLLTGGLGAGVVPTVNAERKNLLQGGIADLPVIWHMQGQASC
jgi:hypothetical protein